MLKLVFLLAIISGVVYTTSTCSNYTSQVDDFIDYANTVWPDANIPSAARLQRYACAQFGAAVGPKRVPDLEPWLRLLIVFNIWNQEAGRFPPTVNSLCYNFLDNDTVYNVKPPLLRYQVGKAAIVNGMRNLGVPLSAGGAGFWVRGVKFSQLHSGMDLNNDDRSVVYSEVEKELVALDLYTPDRINTTLAYRSFYGVVEFRREDTYPLTRITVFNETIPFLEQVQWVGQCGFLCNNCPAGATC